MPIADLPSVRLHYELEGPPDAPVVMLSNSLMSNLSMWTPQLPALLAAFRVLRYDTRGHGESEVTAAPYSIEQLADDAAALITFTGVGVIGELLNAVRRSGHLGFTVTTCVIPQHPKRSEQRRQLRRPHAEVGHQTV